MSVIITTKGTAVKTSGTPILLASASTGAAEAIAWTVYTEGAIQNTGMTGTKAMLRTWVKFGSGNAPLVREFDPNRRFSIVARQVEVYAQIWPDIMGMSQAQRDAWRPIDPNGPDKNDFFAELKTHIGPAIADGVPPTRWEPPVNAGAPNYELSYAGTIMSRTSPFSGIGGYKTGAGADAAYQDREPLILYTACGFNAGAALRYLFFLNGYGERMFVIPVKGGEPFSISLGPTGRFAKGGRIGWSVSDLPGQNEPDVTALFRVDAEIGGL